MTPPEVRTPAELALGWRDALLRRDASAFARLFAPDGVMLDVEHRTPDGASARPLQGRAVIEAETRAWLERTPAFEYDILRLLHDEASAAVLWRYIVPVEGEPLSLEGATWLVCAGGQIREAFVYFDSHRFLRALGA